MTVSLYTINSGPLGCPGLAFVVCVGQARVLKWTGCNIITQVGPIGRFLRLLECFVVVSYNFGPLPLAIHKEEQASKMREKEKNDWMGKRREYY